MRPVAALVIAFALAASPAAAFAETACTCEDARRTNGWCESCGVGYVGDVAIRSHYLWETLDAHGHALDPKNFRCAACVRAAEHGGYCAKSRIGFVDGLAYFSRLTWLLAVAERRALDAGERAALDHDLGILAIANEAAARCEHCAAAIVTDTECPACRIRYQDGKPQ